jgi:hypothetical protein
MFKRRDPLSLRVSFKTYSKAKPLILNNGLDITNEEEK